MLKNYLVIAWRSLLRNRLQSIINILGLSIGISACLVIFLIVFFELSFNRHIPGGENVYRVYSTFSGIFSGENRGVVSALPEYLAENLGDRAQVVGFQTYDTHVTIQDTGNEPKIFRDQSTIIFTPAEYFSIFPMYTWLAGDPQTALAKPLQVVLTESKARTYFGNVPMHTIIGRSIAYRDSLHLTVTGIVQEDNQLTDLDFTDFISASTIEATWLKKQKRPNDWQSTNSASQCFVKTTHTQALQQQLANAGKRYQEHNKGVEYHASYTLQPLADLHFNARIGLFNGSARGAAHKPTLVVLALVAILLLIIAAVNFINLETAQAIKRVKEVGIRKVMGSSRSRLVLQFLLQSFIITLCAVLVAIPLAETAINLFNEFIPQGMKLHLDAPTILFLVAITIIVGLLSGLYPAFVLSSFLPVKALKSNGAMVGANTRAAYLHKSLIVFQFTIAQILIVATFIVITQIKFMLNKDLGFTQEAVVTIRPPWTSNVDVAIFYNKLRQLTAVQDITRCMAPPSDDSYNSSIFKVDNGKEIVETNVYRKFGDANFIPFYGFKVLAGRNIIDSDTTREFVINETYMKMLGFQDPKNVIGLEMEIDSARYPIVGVVKDFHTQSLREGFQPIGISSDKDPMGMVSIKFKAQTTALSQALASVEEVWNELYPDDKFSYSFLDETIANFYKTEQRISKLLSTATTIAIILSCLGLFGLASYTATQRTREIGIRKVLGATVNTIVVMLSKDFIKLVLIAFLIAAPVSYILADQWLQDFAFRVGINAWLFAAAAIGAILIALVTVSYHAIRAALTNPADSLRSE